MKRKDIPITTPIQQRLFQTGAEVIINQATIDDAIFQHSILCQTFLPYRDMGEQRVWQQKQGNVSLAIQASDILNKNGDFEFAGLPYGTKARLILAHINSEAIKNQDRFLNVENSMSSFIKRIGLMPDTKTMRTVKEQLKRISAAQINLGYFDGNKTVQTQLHIVKSFDTSFSKESNKRVSWTNHIELNTDYYESLLAHAIPLDERVLQALSHNAMALDIYAWFAQRLHRITTSQFVSWQNLKDQFGHNYDQMFKFKQVFRATLRIVATQYPTAKFSEDINKGLTLYNSPTPIPQKTQLLMK